LLNVLLILPQFFCPCQEVFITETERGSHIFIRRRAAQETLKK